MSKLAIENTTLTAIGDAIRTKGGTAAPILVSELANNILNLPSGGGSLSDTFELIEVLNAPTGAVGSGLNFTNYSDYAPDDSKIEGILGFDISAGGTIYFYLKGLTGVETPGKLPFHGYTYDSHYGRVTSLDGKHWFTIESKKGIKIFDEWNQQLPYSAINSQKIVWMLLVRKGGN